ncbi:hypothetical protein [Longispora urticae]
MKARLALLTLLLAGGGVLSACSSESGGTIVEKEYEAAGVSHGTKCSRVNGKKKCTSTTKRKSACYEIDFQRKDGSEGEACVTKEEYDRLNVGDTYKP